MAHALRAGLLIGVLWRRARAITNFSRGFIGAGFKLARRALRLFIFFHSHSMRLVLLVLSGPIVVNAPKPERYAVHKLLVYGERPPEMVTKAAKDLAQAVSLI